MSHTVLVVEDETTLLETLAYNLARQGYRVLTAGDGNAALDLAREEQPDVIVLDVMLPGIDGFEVCSILRKEMGVPILMLTARDEEVAKIVGLEVGADDYLAKPFDVRELEARIRAVLRRTPHQAGGHGDGKPTFAFSGWRLDARQRHLFSPEGAMVDLTSGEFDLLLVFVERPQRVLSRNQLLDLARGRNATPFDRSIDVQVSRLRRKIEADPRTPELIKTVRSGGYVFTPTVERQ